MSNGCYLVWLRFRPVVVFRNCVFGVAYHREPGLESPVYGLLGGAPAPPRPPHIFCRPLPRPPRKLFMENPWKIHGVPWVPWVPMGSPWLPWKIQECRKSWILMKTTIRFDRNDEARGPVRCAMSFRSILSRQNPLNRHMEQNLFFGPKIQFFNFRPRDPL